MAYKPGEIYFVRESILGSEGVSSFVKIGLVASPRTSEDRLKEHQTGNPRQLRNQEVVATGAVHRVEAMMHRIYAPHRVSGEWFDFRDEALVLDAIERVKSLADDVASFTPIFDKAQALADCRVADDAVALAATPELEALALRRSIAAGKLSLCKAVETTIKGKFVAAIAAGADVKGAAAEKEIFPAPKFSVTALKKDHPDKHLEYLVTTVNYSRAFKFTLDEMPREQLDADFLGQLAVIEAAVEAVTSAKDAYKLNEPQLQVLQLAALAEWDLDLADAELKVAVGVSAGIEGICTWSGKDSKSIKFDIGRFAEEEPDLFIEYTLTRSSFKRLEIKRKKN